MKWEHQSHILRNEGVTLIPHRESEEMRWTIFAVPEDESFNSSETALKKLRASIEKLRGAASPI